MRKERIDSLKYMRVVAMLLVVLIHTTAEALSYLDPTDAWYQFYLLLNRFTRFEGPVFVFLSGVVLFYNYDDRPFTLKTWLGFYRKRFMYILFPYLVWSLFYEGFSHYMGYRTFENIETVATNIFYGSSNYQLYFILILVQLYFLMPVFVFLIKRFLFVKKYLFLFGFALEYLYQILNHSYNWITSPFFMVYLASFLLGGWVGIYYPKLKQTLSKKNFWAMFAVTVGLGLGYTYLYHQQNVLGNILMEYHVFKFLAICYYLLSCYFLFKAAIWVDGISSEWFKAVIEKLRIYSFGFYLVHPFILALWQIYLVPQTEMQFHLFIFVRYVLVLVSCYVFIRIIHLLFPRAWMIFGKLPDPRTPLNTEKPAT